MSEKASSRDGVERLAAAVKAHYERLGKPMTATAAQRLIAETARRRDMERAAGATKNRAKGVASNKRFARINQQRIEVSAEERRIIEKIRGGSVFVDHGRKKG